MKDIQAPLQQLQPDSGKSTLQALSVIPSTSLSWYFDSACCTHMTSDSSIFTSKTRPIIVLIVHTANNSIMHVQNIGTINTPNFLSLMFFMFQKSP